MNNFRLWLGISLSSFIVLLAIFGPLFAPYDKDEVEPSGYYYNSADDFGVYAAPYPPSRQHPFGTDEWGYDILTLLLYGAKYTVFAGLVIAFFRVVLGSTLGVMAGLNRKNQRKDKGIGFGLLGSIPAFIIIYFALIGISINSSLKMSELIVLQVLLMIIVGFPGVYAAMQAKTMELNKRLFITASASLGASKLQIAVKHIFPHLKGTMLVMFLKEIVLSLSLLGQLGIFNLFLGGTILRLGGPPVYISVSREWTGLIGQWRAFIFDYQWILMFPMLSFLFVVFSFYMLLRGVELQQKSNLTKQPYI
ncbi:ABC transporter permease [Virgibacillus sp. MG-45]|uniref:ABC transporter permease n=1 Tax=Virgibacillus sp. MG-45 TaxID=3102791 RepID=UPI002ED9BB79